MMLLLGDAGSGKSVFAQQLYQQCWQDFKIGNPIPVWISLPELDSPFERAVEEVLEKCGLTEAQIETLKSTERFLFIVDGYDELHNFQNCYESNHWSRWRAKVLITCRTQALYYQRDYEQYFTPYEGSERLSRLLTKLYVSPFNQEQISAYIERYQALNPDQKLLQEDIAKVPNLNELITSPFMLHMAVECLSEIIARHPEQNLLQVNLYDIYIERWFTREAKKVAVASKEEESEDSLKKRFWHYCKDLAVEMHSQKLDVIPYSQRSGGRFGNKQPASMWQRFFTAETVLERSACPLKRHGENYYGFIHATLVNYFAMRTMYELPVRENKMDESEKSKEKIEQGKEKKELQKIPQNHNLYKHVIHRSLFTDVPESIQMLAERIQQDQQFKQEMLWCIEASKKDKDFAIAAANAITALVRAGVNFNGADLREIKIPRADISGGYFDRADLTGADLHGCQLNRVWLRKAHLEECELEGVSFGEYPFLKFPEDIVVIDYQPELNRLVTGSGKKVTIWEIDTGAFIEELTAAPNYLNNLKHFLESASAGRIAISAKWGKIMAYQSEDYTVHVFDVLTSESMMLRGHDNVVTSVHLSGDGRTVATESKDKTVRVWDVASGKPVLELGHKDSVLSIHLSSDGQILASVSGNNKVKVSNLRSGHSEVLRAEYYECFSEVQLSGDGRIMVLKGPKRAQVWDVISGEQLGILMHSDRFWMVQLSGDGRTVISIMDKTVRVWDVKSQTQCGMIQCYTQILSLSIQYNSELMALGLEDGSVQVWRRIDEYGKEWQLSWSSNPSNLSLQLAGCEFTNSSSLSHNKHLLIQRKEGEPEPEPKLITAEEERHERTEKRKERLKAESSRLSHPSNDEPNAILPLSNEEREELKNRLIMKIKMKKLLRLYSTEESDYTNDNNNNSKSL